MLCKECKFARAFDEDLDMTQCSNPKSRYHNSMVRVYMNTGCEEGESSEVSRTNHLDEVRKQG